MPKSAHQREKDYVLTATEMADDETLFIPVNTKKEQQRTFTLVNNLCKDYTSWVDTKMALVVKKVFRDKKLWVAITKEVAPRELFVLGADKATVTRVKKEE